MTFVPVATRRGAHTISYAQAAQSRPGRLLIRAVENASGRRRLIARAGGTAVQIAPGQDFWQVMTARFGLRLDIRAGQLEAIPASGPLIVVGNHPFGILDGLMMGHIMSLRRGPDFRVLANSVFCHDRVMDRHLLPISFETTRAAITQNLDARRAALQFLDQGGAIGVFPGGTVSTAPRPFGQPVDPAWRGSTARMIAKSNATVVPLFFDGQTSRLFQIASHLNKNLRLALLIKEFNRRVDSVVPVSIGAPIDSARLQEFAGDPLACMDFLRTMTYALSPTAVDPTVYGYDFEEKHKR